MQRTGSIRGTLGALLVTTMAVGLLLAGSTRPAALVVLHACVGGCALVALRLDDRQLSNAGTAFRLVRPAWMLLLALAVGLIPLPVAILRMVAPGIAAARPEASWATLSLIPLQTVSELCTLALVLGFGVLVAVWGSGRSLARTFENTVVAFAAGLMVFSMGHVLVGAESILGVLRPSDNPEVFFPPLVNRNHMGTVLLLALPIVTGKAWQQIQRGPMRLEAVLVVGTGLGILAILGVIRSPGVLTCLAVMLLLAALRPSGVAKMAALTLLSIGPVVLMFTRVWPRWVEPEWLESGFTWRLAWLKDAPAAFLEHPLAGFGGGAFGTAFRAYRQTDTTYKIVRHAHNDALEWVLETGVVGGVLLALAVVVLPRLNTLKRRRRARLVSLGLIAVGVHACLDFPLQIPGIALVVVAVAAVRWTVYEPARTIRSSTARRSLKVLALVQLPMLGWQGTMAMVDAASDGGPFLPVAQKVAPWHPDAQVTMLKVGGVNSDPHRAMQNHPYHPEVLRQAAVLLREHGEHALAQDALTWAVARDPNDPRTWLAQHSLAANLGDAEGAAEALVEAFRHWPRQLVRYQYMRDGFQTFPVGLWWLDALATAPPRWSSHLGTALLVEEDFETAILAFEQAARLDPVDGTWNPGHGRALIGLGRPQEAEVFLRKGVEARPRMVKGWFALSRAIEAQGRYREAADVMMRAYDLDNTQTGLRLHAMKTVARGEGPDAALRAIEQLRRDGLGGTDLDLMAAELHLQAGRPDTCLRLLTTRQLGASEAGAALHQKCSTKRGR